MHEYRRFPLVKSAFTQRTLINRVRGRSSMMDDGATHGLRRSSLIAPGVLRLIKHMSAAAMMETLRMVHTRTRPSLSLHWPLTAKRQVPH